MECETFNWCDEKLIQHYRSKIKFDTIDDAINVAKIMNSNIHTKHKLVTYKCSKCSKYHIGRGRKKIKAEEKIKLKNELNLINNKTIMINKHIIAMVGISCSGKSTLAKELQSTIPNSIIVNRDKLREMLFGYTEETISEYYKLPNIHLLEKQVSEYEYLTIERALNFDQVVILDNTHVKLKYLNSLKNFNVPIEYKLVECDLDIALARDLKRLRKVGGDVIKKQYDSLQTLKKNFDFKPYTPEKVNVIVQNTELPMAVIFDLDGTMCKMVSGRSPYDWKRVDEDALNYSVYQAYKAHKMAGHKIIICTGRDAECETLTKEWLNKHSIVWDEYHTRAKGDPRKDSIVKEEMWRDIVTRYHVLSMYDDRNSVVSHGRSLGFSVFQVNYGDF